MTYRSKESQRAFDELMTLSQRYPDRPISIVDNILDTSYFRTFLPQLRDSSASLSLFYEIKANVSKDQLRVLRDHNVVTVRRLGRSRQYAVRDEYLIGILADALSHITSVDQAMPAPAIRAAS